MKRVDMSLVDLVHSGEAWEHELPPCSRQVIHLLERNEEVITWVQVRVVLLANASPAWSFCKFVLRQPKSGSVEDQFPVIRVGDDYYTLSLRMMKAVWFVTFPHALQYYALNLVLVRRNVRLRKGFVNKEKAAFGGLKLKIPMLLFVEKMRTQSRFNVRAFLRIMSVCTRGVLKRVCGWCSSCAPWGHRRPLLRTRPLWPAQSARWHTTRRPR